MDRPLNFALIGAAGYIAPRHLQAIKDTGNILVAALDPSDSVGILDRYFPNASFFTDYERFERYIEKQRIHNTPKKIDYLSICSPNYLHDSHIRMGLRMGANVICEKPITINPWNAKDLIEFEEQLNKGKINTILQVRLHETIEKLKNRIEQEKHTKKEKYNIIMTYITPRGKWYHYSWKGDLKKAGGLETNIGVHQFDMLRLLFGKVLINEIYLREEEKMSGYLELEKAKIKWYLSLDKEDLRLLNKDDRNNNTAYRSITVDGEELDFSAGFTELHTKSYKKILQGNGFGIKDVLPTMEMVYVIRTKPVSPIDNTRSHKLLIKEDEAVILLGEPASKNNISKEAIIGRNCQIGKNVTIHSNVVIGDNVRIDDNTVIGKLPMKAVLSATTQNITIQEPASISSGAIIGTNVTIYAGAKISKDVLIADYASVREDVSIGEKTIIGRNVTVENKVTIGSRCKIQSNVQLVPYTTIEDFVFISPGVMTSNDKYAGRTEKRHREFKGATVKRGARLGVGCILLPGVTVHEDAFVGAGSIVTKDVPPRMIAYGSPAKIVRSVTDDELLENQL